jgi:hypothetical protein
MKRKSARKAKPSSSRSGGKKRGKKIANKAAPPLSHSPPPAQDWEDALVAASARALGLTIDPAWLAGVKFNLQLIFRHAALVDEFVLPDDAEPAPVFHA